MGETVKPKLWLEGFRLFGAHWREWLKWAAWFFVLYVPIQFLVLREAGPYYKAIMEIIKAHPDDWMKQLQNIKPTRISTYLSLAPYMIQAYFFNVFYLQRAPIVKPPALGFMNFFYALGKRMLSFLVMMGWSMLVIVPLIIIGIIVKRFSVLTEFMPLFAILIMAYLMLRYALVYVLAIEQIPSSLKVSAQIMKGNMWRMIWNYIMIYIAMLPLHVFMYGAITLSGYFLDLSIFIPLVILMTATYIIIGGIFSAFVCAAARILYAEKHRADPNFVLTTRT